MNLTHQPTTSHCSPSQNVSQDRTQEDLQSLNEQFAIPGNLNFREDPGGLTLIAITNPHATAAVTLHGGHVTSYQPIGQNEALWVSRLAQYKPGKAIRGGIPICWPWFADHPTDPDKPAHGIVRTLRWDALETNVVDQDQTRIRLGITDNDQTRTAFPHAFDLQLIITVGPQLTLELLGTNTGTQPIVCGGALHSYFTVGDIDDVLIHGLDGCSYIDKVDELKVKSQHGPVKITGLTDSVYVNTSGGASGGASGGTSGGTSGGCVIEDPSMNRKIRIEKSDSRSTVIWNPWSTKAKSMSDFPDDGYKTMVCVEAANALEDVHTIPPGGQHKLGTRIGVE